MSNNICIHLKQLLADEGPFLETEIQRHKLFLQDKSKKSVSRKEAQIDYLDKYGTPYLTGFKDCYCAYVCSEREICDIPKEKNCSIIPR